MAPPTRRERAAAAAMSSSSVPPAAGPGAIEVQRRRVGGGWTNRRISFYASRAYFLLIILQIPLFRSVTNLSLAPSHLLPRAIITQMLCFFHDCPVLLDFGGPDHRVCLCFGARSIIYSLMFSRFCCMWASRGLNAIFVIPCLLVARFYTLIVVVFCFHAFM